MPGYDGISTSRAREFSTANTVDYRAAGLENANHGIMGTGSIKPFISGIVTPYNAVTISDIGRSGGSAYQNGQLSLRAGGYSPVRNLLLAALLLLVTASCGCLGNMPRSKPMYSAGNATYRPGS